MQVAQAPVGGLDSTCTTTAEPTPLSGSIHPALPHSSCSPLAAAADDIVAALIWSSPKHRTQCDSMGHIGLQLALHAVRFCAFFSSILCTGMGSHICLPPPFAFPYWLCKCLPAAHKVLSFSRAAEDKVEGLFSGYLCSSLEGQSYPIPLSLGRKISIQPRGQSCAEHIRSDFHRFS